MEKTAFYQYIKHGETEFFTAVCLPKEGGRFPAVIFRSPYVDAEENMAEGEILQQKLKQFAAWLDNGYAVVYQHCRGRGKSSGDCIPYIYEREDGFFLREWIRKQSFYNGSLVLWGDSYTASVHFVSAPFEDDVKCAILGVQDCERYNCNYRNGFYKMGLHGAWYVGMYKYKSRLKKSFTADSYRTLPLSEFSKAVFGERAKDFDEILRHPRRDDPFWRTRYGGGEAHNAIKNAKIPILLITGFYDIYTGGIFDMWKGLDETTRALCALVVHPFDHGGRGENQPINFENGFLHTAFSNYYVRWADSVLGNGEPPFERGKITYYKLFSGGWCTDGFFDSDKRIRFDLGKGNISYKYNPYAPASFKGGLSTNFGGNAWQDKPNSRYDIISLYTPVFEKDTFVKGSITARLKVSTDAYDTCFYMRLSLCKAEGDYGLRDDINQISNLTADYKPGDTVEMDFSFDEHAFVIKKGEKIRVDISSSAFPHYVPHTNKKGLFSEQREAVVAQNTVCLNGSFIEIPIRTEE